MRNLLLFITIFLFIGLNNAFSAWYGNHGISYSNPGSTNLSTVNGGGPNQGTMCNSDGDTTGGSPNFPYTGARDYTVANNNSSSTLIPETDSEFTIGASGTMRCLYWDGSYPESLSVTYTAGWTNSSKIITVKAKDRGGSKLKKIILQQSQNGGGWTNVAGGTWDNLNAQNTIITRTWPRTLINNYNYKYRIYAYDYAGNVSIVTNNNLIRFDDTPPVANDITSNLSTASTAYYTATNSKYIQIAGSSAGASPIVLIQGQFEKIGDQTYNSTRSSTSDNVPGNKHLLETNENISLIDDYRTTNNYRDYTYKIINVCDEAGNCTSNIKNFTYHVYADDVDTNSSIIGKLNFDDEIADGAAREVKLLLRDIYGNKITPVYQTGGTIKVRDVAVRLNYVNDLYLNQYTNTGVSGIDIKSYLDGSYAACNIGTSFKSITETNKSNNTGDYSFSYKVYTPTADGDTFAIGDYGVSDMVVTLSDLGATTLNNSSVDFKFGPLYTSTFFSSILTDKFIEGVSQDGSITIIKNTGPNLNTDLYLEFGSGASHENSPNLDLKLVNQTSEFLVDEGFPNKKLFKTNIIGGNVFDSTSLLSQTGIIDIIGNQYLSSHIGYRLNLHDVVYNGDIIGMNNYWGIIDIGTIENILLKVLGVTHSEEQLDLTTNQNDINIHTLGKVIKSTTKRDIRKNVFSFIKSMISSNYSIGGPYNIQYIAGNIWNSFNPGHVAGNGTVLYFGNLDGKNIELNTSEKVGGAKTIIIVGGNLYIKSNIINNTNSDILGIIVLKDDNGKGGNVYIKPSVTNIDAIIYTDKSIVSYDENYDNGGSDSVLKHEIDGYASQTLLSNQLYIYGTVFSENTTGGSRNDPPLCPYYAINVYSSFVCTTEMAQRFDLNYLRKYYVKADLSVLNGGIKSIGLDPSYNAFPVIIKYNSNIQITPPPLFDKE